LKIKEQIILGIESSGQSVSVGLTQEGKALGLIYSNIGQNGSALLMKSIDQLITQSNLLKEDLAGICVNLGPGSFTSLRISLATAESLGIALNIPVYGVDGMTLIAATTNFYPKPVHVALEAYKKEFYTATFDMTKGTPKIVQEIKLSKPQDFYDSLQEGELILGSAVPKMLALDLDPTEKKAFWSSNFHHQATGIGVIEYFAEHEAKEPAIVPLEPIYIRLPDAEISYAERFGK
jgi:tRNA threonylcarbamoyladenosine biosynthesis protein TsaB